jgi:hypothetical protein
LILKPVYLAFFVLKKTFSKILCDFFAALPACRFESSWQKKILEENKNHQEIIPQDEFLFPKLNADKKLYRIMFKILRVKNVKFNFKI